MVHRDAPYIHLHMQAELIGNFIRVVMHVWSSIANSNCEFKVHTVHCIVYAQVWLNIMYLALMHPQSTLQA